MELVERGKARSSSLREVQSWWREVSMSCKGRGNKINTGLDTRAGTIEREKGHRWHEIFSAERENPISPSWGMLYVLHIWMQESSEEFILRSILYLRQRFLSYAFTKVSILHSFRDDRTLQRCWKTLHKITLARMDGRYQSQVGDQDIEYVVDEE